MKVLIDMNLSPEWAAAFGQVGWQAVHWSDIGEFDAPDTEIMRHARSDGFLVFTHDLDFGALLASTGAVAPSVIQLRSEDTRPDTMAGIDGRNRPGSDGNPSRSPGIRGAGDHRSPENAGHAPSSQGSRVRG